MEAQSISNIRKNRHTYTRARFYGLCLNTSRAGSLIYVLTSNYIFVLYSLYLWAQEEEQREQSAKIYSIWGEASLYLYAICVVMYHRSDRTEWSLSTGQFHRGRGMTRSHLSIRKEITARLNACLVPSKISRNKSRPLFSSKSEQQQNLREHFYNMSTRLKPRIILSRSGFWPLWMFFIGVFAKHNHWRIKEDSTFEALFMCGLPVLSLYQL